MRSRTSRILSRQILTRAPRDTRPFSAWELALVTLVLLLLAAGAAQAGKWLS